MAVEDQPLPVRPLRPKLTAIREFAPFISIVLALSTVIIADITFAASSTVTPLREEMRLLRTEMQGGLKAVREDITEVRQRLTRVETLLERSTTQPVAPESPQ